MVNPKRPVKPAQDWEDTAFDQATLFTAVTVRGRAGRERQEFDDPLAAMEYAAERPRTAVYAVNPTGRAIVLDRALWPRWRERWLTKMES